jgi:RNA polymerase sigma-70 factor (ECF subfamily)
MTHHHEPGSPGCREIFEKLSEFMDGELPADLCDRIDHHLADCPPCQAFLESLRRTVRHIQGIDAPHMPDEIRQSVRQAYRRYRQGDS